VVGEFDLDRAVVQQFGGSFALDWSPWSLPATFTSARAPSPPHDCRWAVEDQTTADCRTGTADIVILRIVYLR
jgi:hypothetical protein